MNANRRCILAAAGSWALACACAAWADPAARPSAPTEARDTLAKWVETQQLIARERRDWVEGKEILTSRISVVQGEIDALKQQLAEARDKAAEAAATKSSTVAESDVLKRLADQTATSIAEVESGLRALWARLPEPLQNKVKPLYDRMPVDGSSTRISLAERAQNVVGILNEVNRFNGEIALVTEVRTLADGKPAEVHTVYVGLAQAYFVSAKGEAGVGRPSENGWEWASAAGSEARIAETVEVLQNKAKPAFVPLPVKIQ